MFEETFPLRRNVALGVWACGSCRMRCTLSPPFRTACKSLVKRVVNVGWHVPHVARCSVCIEK